MMSFMLQKMTHINSKQRRKWVHTLRNFVIIFEDDDDDDGGREDDKNHRVLYTANCYKIIL